jgi:hypothetical protein
MIAQAGDQRHDQPPPGPAPLHPRHEVDVQARREAVEDSGRGAERAKDVVNGIPLRQRYAARDDVPWTCLADPEGNEFDVVTPL